MPHPASGGNPGDADAVRFAATGYQAVAGKKCVIANPTSITAGLAHEVDVMHSSPDVNLTAVFGPEHGFRGTAQAGGG
ncbi:MAG: DUF1343 domain-containing protein, partial [Actinobacteria bacterium]|nr:DUF1343 domain-containing protein [Actinomycetota bacterium]